MGRYRSRSRSYSPPQRSRSPLPPPAPRSRSSKRGGYDDEPRESHHRGSSRSYGGDRDRDRDRGDTRRSSGPTGLLVRNISLDARVEDLRIPFERFGPVKDVYLPKNYYTG
ncbi:hypothetical protein MKW94_018073, partial [Papaver nudicaule]|nr:hypothetical protein [Papaver nudicaule]